MDYASAYYRLSMRCWHLIGLGKRIVKNFSAMSIRETLAGALYMYLCIVGYGLKPSHVTCSHVRILSLRELSESFAVYFKFSLLLLRNIISHAPTR